MNYFKIYCSINLHKYVIFKSPRNDMIQKNFDKVK